MARHASDALTVTQVGALLNARGVSQAEGKIQWNWRRPTAVDGRVQVSTTLDGCADARLSIGILTARPDTIRLQYIVNNVSVCRVCVNDKHNGWAPLTHVHRYIPASGLESTDKLPEFSPIERGPTVPTGTYKRVFEDFASLVNVQLPNGYWIDPRKEGAL